MNDYEKHTALRSAHEIAKSDAYFGARPQIDSGDRRNVFKAGFERGFDAATELEAAQAQAVPDGYKLVPIEPTEEMFRALVDGYIAVNGDNRAEFKRAYPRMLTAAPTPAGSQQSEPVAWMRPDNRVAEESAAGIQFRRGAQRPPIGTWVPLYARTPAKRER